MKHTVLRDFQTHQMNNSKRTRKKNLVRYLATGGLLATVCAWMQARAIVAADVETIAASDSTLEHLVNCEDPSLWEGMVKVNTETKRSGQFSFELFGKYYTELTSSRMIPVDGNKMYFLSAYFRSLDAQLPASAFMGLRMYDANKKQIFWYNVNALDGTETTLAADALKDSNELRVANNNIWPTTRYAAVAFNAKSNYQDLPNFDISPQIEKVVDEGATSRIILKNKLAKAYPAGTPVRLHSPWGVPLYFVASGWMPTEWKKFSATLSGEDHRGVPSDKFWAGTRYVRVFVWFGNYDKIPKEGARLLVDDITFDCRDKTAAEIQLDQQWEKSVAEQQSLAALCRNPKQTTDIDKQWRFATDAQDKGLASGWMQPGFADQGWPCIDADRWWQDQGYPDYHGVAWYRKTVQPLPLEKGQKYFIHFGAVDGDASVFVNGRIVGERNLGFGGRGWDSPIYFDITDSLTAGQQNTLAVRVKKDTCKSGICKGVKIIRVEPEHGS